MAVLHFDDEGGDKSRAWRRILEQTTSTRLRR